MRIEILREAQQDLTDGFRFYESQATGLGDYFLDSLFSDIDSLHLYAGIHTLHFGYHRLLSKRFPFAIYYRVEKETVRVRAVLDCRRDPARIQKRLT
ncbi:MAG: type II toxin-antitoxin system RelE/ParE family toxin [Lentisphaerae bacterium]|nr:type II toxin-antitoxin system RelE/ParE family toxin [Lentisphaerota bacterium]